MFWIFLLCLRYLRRRASSRKISFNLSTKCPQPEVASSEEFWNWTSQFLQDEKRFSIPMQSMSGEHVTVFWNSHPRKVNSIRNGALRTEIPSSNLGIKLLFSTFSHTLSVSLWFSPSLSCSSDPFLIHLRSQDALPKPSPSVLMNNSHLWYSLTSVFK